MIVVDEFQDLPDDFPLQLIGQICERHKVAELAIFGSALRSDLAAESDVDFLVRFQPGAEKPWMGHFQELEEELTAALGRPVDLVDWKGVERSRNWIRRREILDTARRLFAA